MATSQVSSASRQRTVRRFTRIRAAQLAVALATSLVCAATLSALLGSRGRSGFVWVNHDVANILYLGKRILAGDRLYADLAEINPPGIFFVAEGITALAGWLRVSPVHVFHTCVVLLAVFGVWVIQCVYAHSSRASELTLSCAAFLLVLTGGGLPGEQGLTYSYGQREQWFALVFLPYLLWRPSGQGLGGASYVLCFFVGYLASLKPQFVILVVALELCCLPKDRVLLRRSAPVVAAGALLPYVLLVLHSPQSVVKFWTETIPLHTRGTYAYFDQPFGYFFGSRLQLAVLIYAAGIGYFLWSGAELSARARRSVYVLLPLSYGLLLQQHKFWEYHAIVLIALLVVLVYQLGAALIARLPSERAWPLFVLLSVALAVQNWISVSELRSMIGDWQQGLGVEARLLKIAPLFAGRRRVLYYSTSIAHMRLALLLDQRVIGRFSHELIYPSLVRDGDAQRRHRSLTRYCAEQKQLIESEKPEAVVFHALGQGLHGPEQELQPLLVEQCHVLSEREYREISTADVPEVSLFLRR